MTPWHNSEDEDLIKLLDTHLHTGKRIIISGVLPIVGWGIGKWSRLFTLHTWLEQYCSVIGVPYINNFDMFWERSILFKNDGLHPNNRGSMMLSDNMSACLRA